MTWLNDEDSCTVVQMHAALERARTALLELEQVVPEIKKVVFQLLLKDNP